MATPDNTQSKPVQDLRTQRPQASADDGKRRARWTLQLLSLFTEGRGPGRETSSRGTLRGGRRISLGGLFFSLFPVSFLEGFFDVFWHRFGEQFGIHF